MIQRGIVYLTMFNDIKSLVEVPDGVTVTTCVQLYKLSFLFYLPKWIGLFKLFIN